MLKNTYNKNNKTEEKNLKKIIKKLVENDKFLKEKDLDNKNEIQELITQNSNDLGETKGYVTDNTALIDENKVLIDGNKVLIDGNKVLIDENKGLIDGNKGIIDGNIGLIGDLSNKQSVPVNHIYEMKGDGYCRSGYIRPPSNDLYHNNGLTKNQCFSKCSQNNKCEYMAYANLNKICALYDSTAGECSNRQKNSPSAINHKTYKKIVLT